MFSLFQVFTVQTHFLSLTSQEISEMLYPNISFPSGISLVAEGAIDSPQFWAVGKLSENVLVRKFLPENAEPWAEKNQFWGNLGPKLKFWAPIISSVGNLQLLCGKSATSCPGRLLGFLSQNFVFSDEHFFDKNTIFRLLPPNALGVLVKYAFYSINALDAAGLFFYILYLHGFINLYKITQQIKQRKKQQFGLCGFKGFESLKPIGFFSKSIFQPRYGVRDGSTEWWMLTNRRSRIIAGGRTARLRGCWYNTKSRHCRSQGSEGLTLNS